MENQRVVKELLKLGYIDVLTYKNESLYLVNQEISLSSESLFFVDAGYKVKDSYIFPLSSPIHEIKGILLLNKYEYKEIISSSLASKFDVKIENDEKKEIIIRRQYGMRKILKSEFDSTRYILRKGFPDFPSCPYGHTFKMLGYDMQTETYVRLVSSILKNKTLNTFKYKE